MNAYLPWTLLLAAMLADLGCRGPDALPRESGTAFEHEPAAVMPPVPVDIADIAANQDAGIDADVATDDGGDAGVEEPSPDPAASKPRTSRKDPHNIFNILGKPRKGDRGNNMVDVLHGEPLDADIKDIGSIPAVAPR